MWLGELRRSLSKSNTVGVNRSCDYITKPCQDSTKKQYISLEHGRPFKSSKLQILVLKGLC